MAPYPFPSASSVGVAEGIGGARGLGNLVRPESHPEPRGIPVQWADPGVKPAGDPSDRPVRPKVFVQSTSVGTGIRTRSLDDTVVTGIVDARGRQASREHAGSA